MKSRVVTVLLAWLAAFLIVMAVYLTLGRILEQLPLWLRALAISGVLVISMTQVVMPAIQRSLRRDKKK